MVKRITNQNNSTLFIVLIIAAAFLMTSGSLTGASITGNQIGDIQGARWYLPQNWFEAPTAPSPPTYQIPTAPIAPLSPQFDGDEISGGAGGDEIGFVSKETTKITSGDAIPSGLTCNPQDLTMSQIKDGLSHLADSISGIDHFEVTAESNPKGRDWIWQSRGLMCWCSGGEGSAACISPKESCDGSEGKTYQPNEQWGWNNKIDGVCTSVCGASNKVLFAQCTSAC